MSSPLVAGALALALAATACDRGDPDHDLRHAWIHEQTSAHDLHVRHFLNGTGDMIWQDGWYDAEHDPKTGGAWRWMGAKGIIRFRTRLTTVPPDGAVEITIHGWVPWQHVGLRTNDLELAVNGHVVGYVTPPKQSFQHSVIVPRWMLGAGEWVDFSITATNTARPSGDWRALGFATTGVTWRVASPPK